MNTPSLRCAARALLAVGALICAGCASTSVSTEGEDPIPVAEAAPVAQAADAPMKDAPANETSTEEGTEEVSIAVAETEKPAASAPHEKIDEVVVGGIRTRDQVIRNLVTEAQALLRDVPLEFFYTGKGKKEALRGRPVVFALWSDAKQEWVTAHLEIPRPPVKWKPGGRPLQFTVRTPGIQARHEKGTGAERLMFSFKRGNEELKVYGRKFPVFDNALVKKKQWRAVAESAKPLVYLPFTDDTFDAQFVTGGRDFLLATARKAIDELRQANVPSVAFPGRSSPMSCPPK